MDLQGFAVRYDDSTWEDVVNVFMWSWICGHAMVGCDPSGDPKQQRLMERPEPEWPPKAKKGRQTKKQIKNEEKKQRKKRTHMHTHGHTHAREPKSGAVGAGRAREINSCRGYPTIFIPTYMTSNAC